MKNIYRSAIAATSFCLLMSFQGWAQDEVPAPPPPVPPVAARADTDLTPAPPVPGAEPAIAPLPPIYEDGNAVIIRQKGKKAAKITVELNGGDVKVNGKPISEFSDKNVSVRRLEPRSITITRDNDRDVSLFRDQALNEAQLERMQAQLDRQQQDVSVNVDRALEAQNLALDQQRKVRLLYNNAAWLGVGSKKTEADGALVVDVSSPSPAEKAGLKKGDLITKVEGKPVHNPDDLSTLIHQYKPGDKVKVTVKRDGKEVVVTASLEKTRGASVYNFKYHFQPDVQGYRRWNQDDMEDDQPKIGLKAQDNEDGKGVDVMEVVPGSAAEKAGLKKGDNIVRFDGDEVNSAEDLADKVGETRGKAKVAVSILRDGKTQDIELHIPRKLKSAEL